MSKILIVSGHTDLNASFANKIILGELEKLLPQAKFDILSELYADYRIDVSAEQEKLVNADVIVFAFPFFWYGAPSLMQKWLEDVFVHGFSHGRTGDNCMAKSSSSPSRSARPRRCTAKAACKIARWRSFCSRLNKPRVCAAWSLRGLFTAAGFRIRAAMMSKNEPRCEKRRFSTQNASPSSSKIYKFKGEKIYLINITLKPGAVPADRADELFAAHRAWFSKHFEAGNFLLLGPYLDREHAGLIIAQTANRAARERARL